MRSIPIRWSLLGVVLIAIVVYGGTGLVSAVRASGAGHDHTVFSARLSNLGDLMSPKCRRSPEILCGHSDAFMYCRAA
jgi:hypothetical protein